MCDDKRLQAMLRLEDAVHAVTHMCAIASKLCVEEFDPTGDEGRDANREEALFAVSQAHDLAEKLRVDYLKAADAASD